jgi:lysophospholipase L1-like esterase
MLRFSPVSDEATRNLKFDEVDRWSRALRTNCPRLLVADEESILRYPAKLCWDYSHPNVDGTRVFTKRLASEVQAVLDRVSTASGH